MLTVTSYCDNQLITDYPANEHITITVVLDSRVFDEGHISCIFNQTPTETETKNRSWELKVQAVSLSVPQIQFFSITPIEDANS